MKLLQRLTRRCRSKDRLLNKSIVHGGKKENVKCDDKDKLQRVL